MTHSLLLTCEHAGNQIPIEYAHLFSNAEEVLESHEGWDPGAWEVATYLSSHLNLPVFGCHTSRLVIEANRSLNNAQLFSRYTHSLSDVAKQRLIDDIYFPYRNEIENQIQKLPKPVLHLSIHSFTPVLHNVIRTVDIGLLFDPSRKSESAFCQKFKIALEKVAPGLSIQFNQPYAGVDDGFTTYLRTQYNESRYLGIEIEINQKLLTDPYLVQNGLHQAILNS